MKGIMKARIISILLVAAFCFSAVVSEARWMNPTTGGFMPMDTFEGYNSQPLSLHKYLYCQGNPVNRIDPSGHGDFNLSSLMVSAGTIATMASQQIGALVQRAGPAFVAGGRQAGL